MQIERIRLTHREMFDECHARYRRARMNLGGNRSTLGMGQGASRVKLIEADFIGDFERKAMAALGPVPTLEPTQMQRLFQVYVVQDRLNFNWHNDDGEPSDTQDERNRRQHYLESIAAMGINAPKFDRLWWELRRIVGQAFEAAGLHPVGAYFTKPSGREVPPRPRVSL